MAGSTITGPKKQYCREPPLICPISLWIGSCCAYSSPCFHRWILHLSDDLEEVTVYHTIREYQTSPQSTNEILQKDEKSFVPFVTNAPGFRDYTCIDGGNGTLTSVSLFENRVDGEKFN